MVKRYRAAAKSGHLETQLRLGQIYLHGEHLKKPRYQDARDYFFLAARQGSAEPQCELGWLYYQGRSVDENPAEAIRYLRLAADQGNVTAAGRLGWIHFQGRKTFKWRVVRGRVKETKNPVKNHRIAVSWLRRAAESGDVDSMHGLAICLLEGKGIKVQLAEGMRWLRAAAKHCVHSARLHLGLVLREGKHGELANGTESLKWLKRAAASNESDVFLNALDKIWRMYFYGECVPKNYCVARLWLGKTLRHAAEEDALAAMVDIYEKGLGTKANPRKAEYWSKRLSVF